MLAILSTDAQAPVGTGEGLQYTPPAGSSLTGGQVDVSMYADGHGYNASATAVAYSPEFAYNASNVIFQCAWGLSPCSNATNDYSGVLGLPSNRGGSFYIVAGCGGASGAACSEGGSESAWSLVRVWWANFLLASSATPAANGIGGTLLSPNARATQELTFDATDTAGPGVYTVTVQIDGKTLYTGTPDNNSGECAPVGNSGGVLMFDYSQPCRASESVDLPIDTTSVSDGQHTLKVSVEDAAQNSSVVYDSTITTQNAPADSSLPTILAPGQLVTGAALSTHPGSWSAPNGAGSISYAYQWEDCDTQGNNCQTIPAAESATYTPAPSDVGHTLRVLVTASDKDGQASATSAPTSTILASQGSLGAPPGTGTGTGTGTGGVLGTSSTASPAIGTPNGRTASENAQLHLGIGPTIKRAYPHRALRLTGRLLDAQANPITDATLNIVQQIAGSNQTQTIAHAHTRTDGTFAVRVPAGPSRLIEITYQAFSADTSYAAQAQIQETVSAGVQLNITPRRTSPNGTIILTGTVQGPVPKRGTIVDLLVHYRGRWEPFRTPRTDTHGHFHVIYQFQGATGRFPFRAEVPTGQADFPFSNGYSHAIDVATS